MFGEEEIYVSCPYCMQQISFLLETLHGGQNYIEDCEVCCRPISLTFQVEDGRIESIHVERAQ